MSRNSEKPPLPEPEAPAEPVSTEELGINDPDVLVRDVLESGRTVHIGDATALVYGLLVKYKTSDQERIISAVQLLLGQKRQA